MKTRARWSVVAGLSGAVVVGACSSSSDGDAGANGAGIVDPFVGTWSCTGVSKTTLTKPPGLPGSTKTTSTVVVITDDGKGNVTSSLSTDGGGTCVLPSTLSADRTTLTANVPQSCTWEAGETTTYKDGASKIAPDGASYTSETTWSVEGTTSGGVAFAGTGSTSSTCTRL